MPKLGNPDLSLIADRVRPQTGSLYQTIRKRPLAMKGVTMEVKYNKRTNEVESAFYYEGRMLFHLHARDGDITATFHADTEIREKIATDELVEKNLREQVKARPWSNFPIHSAKEFGSFLGLVRAKYRFIHDETIGVPSTQERPIAV